ncbi:MAG: hypothetical protein HC769_08820 [Cyanobacteria bacterium CRU_2_1]|nr:hypothetical protein [Cyanobacteria bacterium CRU_2_1]
MHGCFANQNQQLAQRRDELDSQLTALDAQLDVINQINAEITQIDAENRALATVFDRIKPWSAVLQDVRGRVPVGVQIGNIEQLEPERVAAPSPSPNASPSPDAAQTPPPAPEPPQSRIQITGYARTFNDVNDFVLTLQRSPFLESEEVKLVTSQLVDNPTQITFDENANANLEVELPQVVQYTIEGSLTNLPASDLLQDLERTLSVGLSTRIQALRDRGIQP